MQTKVYQQKKRSRTLSVGHGGLQMVDNRPAVQMESLRTHQNQQVQQMKCSMLLEGEEADVDVSKRIEKFEHQRNSGGVNDQSRKVAEGRAALYYPEKAEVAGVCNHSRGYDYIHNTLVNNKVVGNSVQQAALTVKAIKDKLFDGGDLYGGDIVKIKMGMTIDRDRYLKVIDYYIQRISDYPGNLFFWGDTTKTEPDMPRGLMEAPPAGEKKLAAYSTAINEGRGMVETAVS